MTLFLHNLTAIGSSRRPVKIHYVLMMIYEDMSDDKSLFAMQQLYQSVRLPIGPSVRLFFGPSVRWSVGPSVRRAVVSKENVSLTSGYNMT